MIECGGLERTDHLTSQPGFKSCKVLMPGPQAHRVGVGGKEMSIERNTPVHWCGKGGLFVCEVC